MNLKIHRPDGTIIEFEGTSEEAKELGLLAPQAPTFQILPYTRQIPMTQLTEIYPCQACNGGAYWSVVKPDCTCGRNTGGYKIQYDSINTWNCTGSTVLL